MCTQKKARMVTRTQTHTQTQINTHTLKYTHARTLTHTQRTHHTQWYAHIDVRILLDCMFALFTGENDDEAPAKKPRMESVPVVSLTGVYDADTHAREPHTYIHSCIKHTLAHIRAT